MNTKLIAASLIGLAFAANSFAQDKEAPKARNEERIIIRKKGDSTEKMTVVIDGDKVTVNGKPVEDFKDGDIQILKSKIERDGMISPHAKVLFTPGYPRSYSGDLVISGNKAFLGVQTEKDEKGAKISSVTKGSSAEKAGLLKDDIITKVGDTKITTSDDLYKAIGKYKPEDKVAITYLRNGKENSATAALGKNNIERSFTWSGDNNFKFEMPEIQEAPGGMHFNFSHNSKPRLGVQIQDVEEGTGVKIIGVDDESVAGKAGLKEKDVIVDVDGKEIKNVDDLRTKINEAKEGNLFKIKYKRDGKTQTADVKFPKRLKTANL